MSGDRFPSTKSIQEINEEDPAGLILLCCAAPVMTPAPAHAQIVVVHQRYPQVVTIANTAITDTIAGKDARTWRAVRWV